MTFSSVAWASSSALDFLSCDRSSSVRMLDEIMLRMTPMLSMSWSRNVRWFGLNAWNEASSMTAFVSPSKSTGSTTTLRGGASPIPVAM